MNKYLWKFLKKYNVDYKEQLLKYEYKLLNKMIYMVYAYINKKSR